MFDLNFSLSIVKWNVKDFEKDIDKGTFKNITKATIHVQNKTKENLSDAYPPAATRGTFPHRRTGELRRSIAREMYKELMEGRVGTNKVYGRHLEYTHPYLRPTLSQEQKEIAKIMTEKIK